MTVLSQCYCYYYILRVYKIRTKQTLFGGRTQDNVVLMNLGGKGTASMCKKKNGTDSFPSDLYFPGLYPKLCFKDIHIHM